MKKIIFAMFLIATPVNAGELIFNFNSPAFNGIGYSSHVLSVYNAELSRKLAREAQRKADLLKAELDAKNTVLARFIQNLETRVYNELARQMVDRMFSGDGSSNQFGSFTLDGNSISWVRDGTNVVLTVTDTNGTVTTITVPLGDFGWIPPA